MSVGVDTADSVGAPGAWRGVGALDPGNRVLVFSRDVVPIAAITQDGQDRIRRFIANRNPNVLDHRVNGPPFPPLAALLRNGDRDDLLDIFAKLGCPFKVAMRVFAFPGACWLVTVGGAAGVDSRRGISRCESSMRTFCLKGLQVVAR